MQLLMGRGPKDQLPCDGKKMARHDLAFCRDERMSLRGELEPGDSRTSSELGD
jgi:hypothetical protein